MNDTPAAAIAAIAASDTASDTAITAIGASDAVIVAVDGMNTITSSIVFITSHAA